MSLSVLLVEDDRDLRQTLVEALKVEGYAVSAAASAADARAQMRHAQAGAFDVVLLDLGLPDGHGEELLQEWRRQQPMPILVISAEQIPCPANQCPPNKSVEGHERSRSRAPLQNSFAASETRLPIASLYGQCRNRSCHQAFAPPDAISCRAGRRLRARSKAGRHLRHGQNESWKHFAAWKYCRQHPPAENKTECLFRPVAARY